MQYSGGNEVNCMGTLTILCFADVRYCIICSALELYLCLHHMQHSFSETYQSNVEPILAHRLMKRYSEVV